MSIQDATDKFRQMTAAINEGNAALEKTIQLAAQLPPNIPGAAPGATIPPNAGSVPGAYIPRSIGGTPGPTVNRGGGPNPDVFYDGGRKVVEAVNGLRQDLRGLFKESMGLAIRSGSIR